MRKHQFVKKDCNCQRRATYYICRWCGRVEFGDTREMRGMELERAACPDDRAPLLTPGERFQASMGGGIDCLEPGQVDHPAAGPGGR